MLKTNKEKGDANVAAGSTPPNIFEGGTDGGTKAVEKGGAEEGDTGMGFLDQMEVTRDTTSFSPFFLFFLSFQNVYWSPRCTLGQYFFSILTIDLIII